MKAKEFREINKEGMIEKRALEKNIRPSIKVDYYQYLNLGVYLAAPLVGGVFLGLFLDKILGTKPFFVLLLIVFGAIASLYNLIKLTQDKNAPH